MKFSTMILLAPLKVHLKTKRSPFTVCEYLVWIQSYEGLNCEFQSKKMAKNWAQNQQELIKFMTSQCVHVK